MIKDYKRKYYSDIISDNQIFKWIKNNDYVYLNGDTGTGKTTFVFSKLIDYILNNTDKSIFLLSNRKLLTNQHRQEVKSRSIDIDFYNEHRYFLSDRLYIMTYHSFFKHYVKNKDFKIDVECGAYTDNTVFICDECHYFLNDYWNNNTDGVLSTILDSKCTTFFISATGDNTIKYINSISDKKITKDNTVSIPQIYTNIKLRSLKDNNHNKNKIINLISDILDNTSDKVMYYLNDAENLSELALILKEKYDPDDIKLCYSVNNRSKPKLPTEHQFTFTEDKKMNCRCILTTCITDNGIDIYDDDLKHVIIDMTSPEIMIQAIGRKRTKTPLTVYIVEQHITTLNKRIKDYKSNIKNTKSNLNKYQFNIMVSDAIKFKEYGAINVIYDRLKHTQIKLVSNDSKEILLTDLQYYAVHQIPIDKDYLISLLSDIGIKAKQIDKINAAFSENNINYHLYNKRERLKGCKNAINVWYVSA